jgi:hypothetical protein
MDNNKLGGKQGVLYSTQQHLTWIYSSTTTPKNSTHDAPVGEGVESNCALAHMHEPLRDPYYKEAVGLFVIGVARKLP